MSNNRIKYQSSNNKYQMNDKIINNMSRPCHSRENGNPVFTFVLTLVILVSFVIGTFGFGISLEPALSLSKGQLGQLEIRSIPKA